MKGPQVQVRQIQSPAQSPMHTGAKSLRALGDNFGGAISAKDNGQQHAGVVDRAMYTA